MNENNIDEKLIRWNDIFDQMVVDVQTLVKDFSGMINTPVPLAVLLFAIGGGAFAATILLGAELLIVAYSFFLMCCMIASGILVLRHWYAMKVRYDRLFALQRAMESKE
ncbi:MAG: hypothetical protein EAX81_07790 [Candidatus Thorarchaeota archaeon]|nr:hypothetical protein [Candidatus Thorarchaeota archaeon]